MKRIIASSENGVLLESPDGLFKLVERSGTGRSNIPYRELRVISDELARQYVVEIRLGSTMPSWEDANEVQYKYYKDQIEVAHGMSARRESLADTAEYIDVLTSALEFATEIALWLMRHREWLAR